MRRRGWMLGLLAACFAGLVLAGGVIGCGKKNTAETTGGGSATTSTPPAESTATPGATANESGSGGDPVHGKVVFETNDRCVTCHGREGRGDGPLAASLNPKPRNYHDTGYMNTKTDDELFHSVKYGKSQMPAWGQQGLSDQDIRDAIAYVRQLEKKS